MEILSLNCTYMENVMKQLIFNKSIFKSYDIQNPEKLSFFLDGINFEVY